MSRWNWFKREDFACKHCGRNEIQDDFVDKLDDLRDACNFPLPVSSGYRCPVHNANVSSTGANGPHTTGRSADLAVSRAQAFKVLQMALVLGFTGIGVQQKGNSRFIHLDDLPNKPGQPRPTIWSY